jgi:hypothetical protein
MSTEDATVNSSYASQTTLVPNMASQDEHSYASNTTEPAEQNTENVAGGLGEPIAGPPAQANKKYIAYTIKLPSEQLSALQSIWLELKRLYGVNSPDKSGMIQQAVAGWLKEWDSTERTRLLNELLEIREDTRRRQYRKGR